MRATFKEAKCHSEATVDAVAKALARVEARRNMPVVSLLLPKRDPLLHCSICPRNPSDAS